MNLRAVCAWLTLVSVSELAAQSVPVPPPAQGARPISSCTPPGYDRDALLALKQDKFAVADDARRNALALALGECLGDPDPLIRDGVAYEALTHFMRGQQLTQATLVALRERLLAQLRGPAGDGLVRPFAALVLAEVARTDRIDPYLSPTERADLVTAATEYVRGVTDYRGFDEREGWRHGVAHGADFLMQLAYNPMVTHDDLRRILEAVASQVAPPEHTYTAGESDRLARPVIAVASRAALTEGEWTAWFARVGAPAPLARWEDAHLSALGLAKRHNTSAFLSFIHRAAKSESGAPLASLLPGVEAALGALP